MPDEGRRVAVSPGVSSALRGVRESGTSFPVMGGQASPSRAETAPPTPPPAREKLSASGEVISEYSGSREAGWRGAGAEIVEKSIQEHLAAGRKGSAARIARDAGQYGRALAWFEELELHYAVGACLTAIGRYDDALIALLREETSSPNYRKACFEVIGVVKELGRFDFDIDHFLTKFIADGPADRDEVATYFDLAGLYVEHGFAGGAKRCLRRVLAADPEHAGAKQLDVQLRRESRSKPPPSSLSALPASARGLPPLPPLEAFAALAKKHAPGSETP